MPSPSEKKSINNYKLVMKSAAIKMFIFAFDIIFTNAKTKKYCYSGLWVSRNFASNLP